MRVLYSLMIVVFCCVVSKAHAQTEQFPAFGIYGNFNLNMYSADFRNFPGVPSCCPMYQDGGGTGVSAGVLYQLPLGTSMRIAFRAGYNSRSGLLSRTENTTVAGNIPGTFEHTVDAKLADIGLEPLFQYNIVSKLWLNVGPRIAFVTTKTFSQKEAIISPSNGVFPNGSSTRNELSNVAISDASSLFVALLAGVSYDLPLNNKGTMVLAPEVFYSLGITPVVSGLQWNTNSLRVGLALTYSPEPHKTPTERIEKKQRIDTVRSVRAVALSTVILGKESIELKKQETDDEIVITQTLHRTDTLLIAPKPVETTAPTITASITANGLDANGEEHETIKIHVEEFSSVLMTPLLNYIFFDDSSSVLPVRYNVLSKTQTETFDEQYINKPDRLSTYYHVLNIIGKRLKETPSATLTLTGCNADVGGEKGNTALSKKRAETVKDYFVQHWGIAETRLKVTARNLPEKASLTQSEEGYQENRRVEIVSSVPSIIAPVITHDTLRKSNPPSVRFHPQVAGNQHAATWVLTAEQAGTIVKQFEGTGAVPAVIDWNLDADGTHPRTEEKLTYTLQVTDATATTTARASSSIPVEQLTIHRKQVERREDKEIHRYSLIQFEVRSSEITANNKPIVELIRKDIQPTSKVVITGNSDGLGNSTLNKQISERRALATVSALQLRYNDSNVVSEGKVITDLLDRPERRFYARNVDVVIETPIKE